MLDYQLARSSFRDSLKALEADIQHANFLAASIPRTKNGSWLQMKLAYNNLTPIFLFFIQWMNCSCTYLLPSYLNLVHIVIYKVHPERRLKISSYGRKATLREFYAVILPSLQHLHSYSSELDYAQEEDQRLQPVVRKRPEERKKLLNVDLEREDECGICLEPCTKMVLPNCCHMMCISCFRDWNTKSESCPFCRVSLKRVNSGDLWVLPCRDDVVDMETVSKEDVLHFYLYIHNLPKNVSCKRPTQLSAQDLPTFSNPNNFPVWGKKHLKKSFNQSI
eukprot:XP_010663045.1 PREDICTED: probable E3 ubiquitin-protein ligase makorin-2 isoform X1 [Vitis vinifera]